MTKDFQAHVFKNPHCRKVRGAHLLNISCGGCKAFIALYQKVGESNLVKMYIDRIVEASVNLERPAGAIFCPNCNVQLATKYTVKADKKEAYRLVPSSFNKKKAHLR